MKKLWFLCLLVLFLAALNAGCTVMDFSCSTAGLDEERTSLYVRFGEIDSDMMEYLSRFCTGEIA